MLYCFDKKMNFDYTASEIKVAKLNNNCIFYDDNNTFLDSEGNNVDIEGKIIFPRTGSEQIFDMNDAIEKKGGIPVISNAEVNKVLSWPNYYLSDRKIQILKGSNLINPDIISYLESIYGKEIFLKTKVKNFNSIISTQLLRDKECAFYKTLMHHLDDEFIVSKKVDIVEDNYGKKEYRCVIINNEIYNISRITIDVLHGIDSEILKKLGTIIEQMKNIFPPYYVVDLFEYYDEHGKPNLDVLEFNPIHASGIYLYNSVIEKSNDLLHTNLRNISREFLDGINEYTIDGKVNDNRESLYNVRNSFSYDLRSICLTGGLGLTFSDAPVPVEYFVRHSGVYSFQSFKLIEDDADLSDKGAFGSNELDNSELNDEQMDMLQKLLKLNKKI